MDAFEAITPDTHAKYLLTSGSTGHPKVVINTHRMLCANQQMIAQVWRFLEHEKPVLVDWLPWSHTFGGNHNLHMVLRNGGTLVIDEGRPAPGLVERSVANLAEVQPTIWFNVPRGFDMALPLLEADLAPGAARVRAAARGVLCRRRAAAGHLGTLAGAGEARCAARRSGSPPAGARPRPRRASPARTGSWTAPASSACRCRGWS